MYPLLLFLTVLTLAVLFLAWRLLQSPKAPQKEENEEPVNSQQQLGQRLRHALYWAERHERQAKEELESGYRQQKELLEKLGRPSYVELPSKILFFCLRPIEEGQSIYYYQRDLQEKREDYLEESQRILQEFEQEREVLVQQIGLFRELQQSHRENLQRLEALKKGDQSWAQLKRHRQYLAQQKAQDKKEEAAILQQYRLALIAEELAFQEDCQQAYEELLQEDRLLLGPELEQLRAKVEQQDPDRG